MYAELEKIQKFTNRKLKKVKRKLLQLNENFTRNLVECKLLQVVDQMIQLDAKVISLNNLNKKYLIYVNKPIFDPNCNLISIEKIGFFREIEREKLFANYEIALKGKFASRAYA